MANEITISSGLSLAIGNWNLAANKSTQATQTTPGGVQRRQSVPTSDTVLTVTGVTTPRAIHITNLDATNYIDIGPTVSSAIAPCARLKAGESLVMPLVPTVVLRGQANTSAVNIEMLILET